MEMKGDGRKGGRVGPPSLAAALIPQGSPPMSAAAQLELITCLSRPPAGDTEVTPPPDG